MKITKWRQAVIILLLSVAGALGMFAYETFFADTEPVVSRNAYGEGTKTETYELMIEDEEESREIALEVAEQEYTAAEAQELLRKAMEMLDEVMLGENESFDRIEQDLQLVNELESYPVQIQWELDSYDVIDIEGKLRKEELDEQGTLVEIRAILTYKEEQAIYVRNVMVYPKQREGMDKLLYDIQQEIIKLEESTRTEAKFALPDEVAGVQLNWAIKKESRWYYILFIGVVCAGLVVYREQEKLRERERQRRETFMRMYPGMISKFTMLLSTGVTVKYAWEKIVENYEAQKDLVGEQLVYEEMNVALREIRGGISEGEAYERFGKRCGNTIYMKFGTLLAQNLRKGSKGIADLLRMEAIQAFENRKSIAKRQGEEASAKLLVPMIGMLAIVLIMVMVPAFLNMQL